MTVHTKINGPHGNNGPVENAVRRTSGRELSTPNECPRQAQGPLAHEPAESKRLAMDWGEGFRFTGHFHGRANSIVYFK